MDCTRVLFSTRSSRPCSTLFNPSGDMSPPRVRTWFAAGSLSGAATGGVLSANAAPEPNRDEATANAATPDNARRYVPPRTTLRDIRTVPFQFPPPRTRPTTMKTLRGVMREGTLHALCNTTHATSRNQTIHTRLHRITPERIRCVRARHPPSGSRLVAQHVQAFSLGARLIRLALMAVFCSVCRIETPVFKSAFSLLTSQNTTMTAEVAPII